jgi:hypothetical protein
MDVASENVPDVFVFLAFAKNPCGTGVPPSKTAYRRFCVFYIRVKPVWRFSAAVLLLSSGSRTLTFVMNAEA